MNNTSDQHHFPTTSAPLPPVVDRTAWQAELNELRVREKAHTRAGDALAAARRRLPMVEVDSTAPLIGSRGYIKGKEVSRFRER